MFSNFGNLALYGRNLRRGLLAKSLQRDADHRDATPERVLDLSDLLLGDAPVAPGLEPGVRSRPPGAR